MLAELVLTEPAASPESTEEAPRQLLPEAEDFELTIWAANWDFEMNPEHVPVLAEQDVEKLK